MSGQIKSDQDRSGQVMSGKIRSVKVWLGQVWSDKVRCGQVWSGQVRLGLDMASALDLWSCCKINLNYEGKLCVGQSVCWFTFITKVF